MENRYSSECRRSERRFFERCRGGEGEALSSFGADATLCTPSEGEVQQNR